MGAQKFKTDMIKIFETSKIKELDQYTVDHEPIASVDLVERAATAFVNEFGRLYSKQSRGMSVPDRETTERMLWLSPVYWPKTITGSKFIFLIPDAIFRPTARPTSSVYLRMGKYF